MTTKDEIHVLVESLPDAEAHDALDYLRWLASESDTLTDWELAAVQQGDEEIARGETISLADLKKSLTK